MADETYDPVDQLIQLGIAKPVMGLPTTEPATGLKKYTRALARGATLGATGEPSQGIGPNIAEFVGSIPTIAGVSAVASPIVAGVLKTAVTAPLVRLGTGATIGGLSGAAQALSNDEDILPGALTGAALGGAAEAAWMAGSRLLWPKVKVPTANGEPYIARSGAERIVDEQIQRGRGQHPETPQVLNIPGTYPEARPGRGIGDLYPTLKPDPIPGDGTILRYEGGYQTLKEAIDQSTYLARQAIEAGAPSVRIGGITPQGNVMVRQVAGEEPTVTRLNAYTYGRAMPGAKPAYELTSVDTVFDPVAGRQVFVPKNPQVETALDAAAGVDPRANSLPLTPGQVSSVQTPGNRSNSLDIRTQQAGLHPDVIRTMEESMAVKALVNDPPVPSNATITVNMSEGAQAFQALMHKASVVEADLVRFLETLPKNVNKAAAVREWFRLRCS